jgi:Flp pilus assembly protein TadD
MPIRNINVTFSPLTRAALAVAGGALLLTACAPDQQATRTRPVTRVDDEIGAMMRVAAMTRQSGDVDTAIALYRRAHELDPRDPQPLIELARLLDERGAPADAALMWQEALRIAPDDAVVLGGYGLTMARLGQPELARTYLQKATAVAPTATTWNALGVVRDQLGDAPGAQAAYRAGLKLEPSDLRLANNLGLSLALSGQFGEALPLLEAAAARPDATSRHRQNLALAYALDGREEPAARLAGSATEAAEAQRNILRYAGIAALPDHASRVAAVSALRSALPARQQAATAVAMPAPLPSAEPNEAKADGAADRVTPLVMATRLSPATPNTAPAPGQHKVAAVQQPSGGPLPTAANNEPATPSDAAMAQPTPVIAAAPPAPRPLMAAVAAPTQVEEPAPPAEAVNLPGGAVDATAEAEPAPSIAANPRIYRSAVFSPATLAVSPAGSEAPALTTLPRVYRSDIFKAAGEPGAKPPIALAADDGSREAPLTAASLAAPFTVAEAPANAPASAAEDAVAPASVAELVMSSDSEAAPRPETPGVQPDAPDADGAVAALPLALAGIAVPSVDDQLLVAASAYHAGEYAFAAHIWQPLADAGSLRAQFHLGALYYEGRGVERDLAKAYMLLRQAELAGFGDARVILALVEAKLPDSERKQAEAQVAAARP